jgi:hypothetical protein
MHRALLLSLAIITLCAATDGWARREALTDQQKQQLKTIDRILVDVIALTDQGPGESGPFRELVSNRLSELGYIVLSDPAHPHNVVLKVKCEQRKVWEGTMASGGDADLPDSPLRTWKGPACQLTYLLNGTSTQWKKEVRTEFSDAIKAAAEAKAADPGTFALQALREKLEAYDFPVLVTADWGQEDRLIHLLQDDTTAPARKARVIRVLGEMFSAKAVPYLQAALKDPDADIPKAAALALGNIGHQESIAALVEMLRAGVPDRKVAAAKALGKVGALHGDASIIPPLLETLKTTDDLVLKTEVVWALGQLPDRRAYEPLAELQRSLRNVRTSDRTSQDGKLWDAVLYALKQLDGFDQIN